MSNDRRAPSGRPERPGPWIEVKHEQAADLDPELLALYRQVRDPRGHVDNILKIHSLHPASLRAHHELYRVVMYGPSPLSRPQREMIGVVVSVENRCHY